MPRRSHLHPSDLRGSARLATDAVAGAVDVAEALHRAIARPFGLRRSPPGRARGLTGRVYGLVRRLVRLVGGGVDRALAPAVAALGDRTSTPRREAVLAALNGVLGDHLAATGNPLAIPMRLRQRGEPLTLDRAALAAAIPEPRRKLLVLVHGICMNDLEWNRRGHDHGAALARDAGYTALYLHYNSGLHVSTNGRAFADLLETLIQAWPVPVDELALVGHSMGGLVSRSACHYGAQAGHTWTERLRTLVCLGTPHHGAPLERGGNGIDALLGRSPYTAPFARLGHIRSAGVTDLRYGNLVDEDWQGRDRFARAGDTRRPVPLPAGARCYALVATTGTEAASLAGRVVGDGLVPVPSALGHHAEAERALAFPEGQHQIAYGLHHFDLLGAPGVYEHLARWLGAGPAPAPAEAPAASAS